MASSTSNDGIAPNSGASNGMRPRNASSATSGSPLVRFSSDANPQFASRCRAIPHPQATRLPAHNTRAALSRKRPAPGLTAHDALSDVWATTHGATWAAPCQ